MLTLTAELGLIGRYRAGREDLLLLSPKIPHTKDKSKKKRKVIKVKIIKRNGQEAIFDRAKIESAVGKANEEMDDFAKISHEEISALAADVEKECNHMGQTNYEKIIELSSPNTQEVLEA